MGRVVAYPYKAGGRPSKMVGRIAFPFHISILGFVLVCNRFVYFKLFQLEEEVLKIRVLVVIVFVSYN